MIDLVQLTDTCGDPVFVNPAAVRMVSPLMLSGRTTLTFGDEGEEAELTVQEPYMVVVPLLTGKSWQAAQEALLKAQAAEAEWYRKTGRMEEMILPADEQAAAA